MAANVRNLRKVRGLSLADVADAATQLGRSTLPSAIHKIERATRQITVDDLVTLALVFRVSPLRLLLPVDASQQDVALTPTVTATQAQAWAWALAESPLLAALPDEELDTGDFRVMLDDFRRTSLPHDLRLREDHSAVDAAHAVLRSVRQVLNRAEHPDEYEREDYLRTKSPKMAAKLGPDPSTAAGLRARLKVLSAQIDALIGEES